MIDPVTPREVLKQAFAAGIVPDGQIWIDMLNHRNLLSHNYDCAVFEEAVEPSPVATCRRSNSCTNSFLRKGANEPASATC